MMEFLALLGIVLIAEIIIIIFYITRDALLQFYRRFKSQYYYQHRFDKPPTAKCYCKDCIKHCNDQRCIKFGKLYTADNWFCWDAEPRKEEKQ